MDRLEDLVSRVEKSGDRYLEFLRVAPMSAGVYVLPVGAIDLQLPHEQDELYYVIRGRGQFRHEAANRNVVAGDLLYVPAHEAHQFHTIEEELVLLVVFAPAETAVV